VDLPAFAKPTPLKPLIYRSVLLSGLLALASCTAPPVQQPAPAAERSAQPPPAAASPTTHYRIDSAASTVHILVYRGGVMARLGHNHVITAPNIQGRIWRGALAQDSGFELSVPVATLVVDDNAARAAEGKDFPLNIPDDAKTGTRDNMLRESLLDSAHYPDITLRALRISANAGDSVVVATLRIKNQSREVTVPVTLQSRGAELQVRGEFQIKQSDFGITPLSIAMGALQVVDTITLKFALVGRAD
jgi:polyisoprenoid-binding protein YceI